jgi:hypothetical protein
MIYTKKIILLSCFFISQLKAQTDTLITLSGKKEPVIITEITSTEIIYKLPNKTDLPLFHCKRSLLSEIIFKDGTSINPKFKSINPYDKIEYPKAKTIIYFTPTKLFQNHIAFAYEYIFRKNIVGIRIPASVSFMDAYTLKPQGAFLHRTDIHRTFTTGIDVNFYLLRIGKLKYVTGIGFQFAQFAYRYYPSYYGNNYIKEPKIGTGNHYSFVINNGIISQVTKHFIICGTIGTGSQIEIEPYYQTAEN